MGDVGINERREKKPRQRMMGGSVDKPVTRSSAVSRPSYVHKNLKRYLREKPTVAGDKVRFFN